jgi:hypothetical protein
MKNKYLIIVLLLGLAGIFTMPSCTKDESPTPVVFKAAVPANPTPADGARVKFESTSLTLKWDGAATTTWDVYFGPAGADTLYKSGVTGNSLTITVPVAGEYSWHVYTIDANKVYSKSATWNFTLWENITVYLGNFTVDEPAESWPTPYHVNFTRHDANTLDVDAWWDSWPSTFALDYTNNTYTMAKTDFGGGYEGEESGTIDPKTGTLKGNYTIWQNGAIIEQGPHTYTKN